MNIKELAKQAGELVSLHDGSFALFGNETIKRFAELVAAAEREACAKLCEKVHDDYINDRNNDGYDWPDGYNCAEAIRARTE